MDRRLYLKIPKRRKPYKKLEMSMHKDAEIVNNLPNKSTNIHLCALIDNPSNIIIPKMAKMLGAALGPKL